MRTVVAHSLYGVGFAVAGDAQPLQHRQEEVQGFKEALTKRKRELAR